MRDVSEDGPGDGDLWMSYSEAARALGIDIGSVKKRARRRGWRRQAGNDGTTRVAVPRDALSDVPEDVPADDPRDASADVGLPSSGTSLLTNTALAGFRGQIAALENHIATLREQLLEARRRAASAEERVDEALADLRAERTEAAEERRRSADRIAQLEGEVRSERAGWRTQVDALQAEVRRLAGLLGAGAEEHQHLVTETAKLVAATQKLLGEGPAPHPPDGILPIEELAALEAELDEEGGKRPSDASPVVADLLPQPALVPVLSPDAEERSRLLEPVIEESAKLDSEQGRGADTAIPRTPEPAAADQSAASQISPRFSELPWFQWLFRRRSNKRIIQAEREGRA